MISDHSDADAIIIFGAIVDDGLDDSMKVTVIAAGFDRERAGSRKPLLGIEESEPVAEDGSESEPAPAVEDEGGDDMEIPGFVQG